MHVDIGWFAIGSIAVISKLCKNPDKMDEMDCRKILYL